MDRLTAREPKKGMAYLVNVKPDEQEVDSRYPNTLRCIMDSWERLAQYEETGLSPDEASALQSDRDRLAGELEQVRAQLDRAIDILFNHDVCPPGITDCPPEHPGCGDCWRQALAAVQK